ncbi:ATP-binding cassette domain-containing protein [Actinomadura roseirufa]|uniref:ATP-binding cassette domain-containing protein n=1 Tax=Actinomadura roseirufa TaxID=2094049 RepID=UPI0010418A46|nr:ATP-binding cassette domain-containing protein [Actinomadura roseirufa]
MPISFISCAFGYRRGSPVFTDLSFRLPEGRTVLLGPNGAGKSTLLGLAASLHFPSAGAVAYKGLDPRRRRDRASYRRLVGWMPQDIRPVPGLTVREQIGYAGWLKGMSRREAWRRSADALDAVALGPLAGRRCGQLSGGQLRRVGLAQALVHDAEVILLDEPTAGLDPGQRERFRQVVTRLGGRHLVVSTHQTEDLGDLYESVVVLDGGTVKYAGSTAEFLALSGDRVPSAEASYALLVAGEA